MSKKGIDKGAFANQTAIASVVFGKQCYFIGENAFEKCTSLSEINDDNVIETINSNAFESCTNLKNIIFDKCEEIGKEAFANCNNLTSINIPNCSIISSDAFVDCSNLKNINFDKCEEIGKRAFKNCTGLNNEIYLKQCKKIDRYAFSGCNNIPQVTLDVCEEIYPYAFADCSNLTKVYINNPPNIFCKLMDNPHGFCSTSNCPPNNITFYFKADSYDNYRNDDNWKHYLNYMATKPNNNEIIYKTNDGNAIEIPDDIKNQIGIKSNEYFTSYGLITFNDKIESLNTEIFKEKKTLTSVDLPSECETIEENAFENCENLINIKLSNVKNIGNYAFKNCKAFTSFEIPSTIKQLGEGIFAGCENIKKFEGNCISYNGKVVIYDSTLICVVPKDDSDTEGRIYDINNFGSTVKKLGESCFHGCVNMRRVDIPDTVTNIGSNVFEGCNNLYEVHFKGNTPPTLGSDVFKDVKEDFKIFVPENSLENYNNKWSDGNFNNIYPKAENGCIIYYSNSEQPTVKRECPNGEYIKISHTDEIITDTVFKSKADITKVILGENIKKISENAFSNCKNLEYVYLSDSITQLGNSCFSGCVKLERIHIPGGFNLASNSVGSDVFYGCTKLKEFGTYYKNRVSNDNMCYIDTSNCLTFFAQGGLSGNNEYSIPEYVTKIHKTAFKGSNIENIKLTMSTKVIGDYAFSECANLKSIENWDNVETISLYAFYGCSDLGRISLPSKLKTISSHAFDGCEIMYTDKNIPDSVTVIGSYAFNDCFEFKYFDDIKQEQAALNLGNISYINESSFNNCSSLTKVNINDKIEKIGYNSFANCSKLQSVSISNSSILSRIENSAFYKCPNLEELYLPESLQYIGESAFEYCGKYKGGTYMILDNNEKEYSLLLPYNINSLGTSCFKNSGIEKLNITQKSRLGSIPNSAFQGCRNLKIVNMLDATNIQSIGSNAFEGCSNLEGNLELPNGIKTIKDKAFYGCSHISSVTLPIYLRSLGDLCFATEDSITYIHIPTELYNPPVFTTDDVENIDSNPFGDISETPTTIYVHRLYIDTYKNDTYWEKYKENIKSKNTKEYLEDYISSIICDTNGFDSVVSPDMSANVIFHSNIPTSWVGTTVYFNAYDETDKKLPQPGGIDWSFTLADNLATGGVPQVIVIVSGSYSALGGTKENPAKYIKITSVSNMIVKYSGENIGVSNC